VFVAYAVIFAGEHFYPEPNPKYHFERHDSNYVYPGRLYDWDRTPLYVEKYPEFGASRHFTNVFNIFVVCQIFYLVCVRKLNDNEKNILGGLSKNYVFLVVILLISVGQVAIV